MKNGVENIQTAGYNGAGKGESEDEGRWKLHLISSGSWKFISVKIWNSRSGIFLSSEYAISK